MTQITPCAAAVFLMCGLLAGVAAGEAPARLAHHDFKSNSKGYGFCKGTKVYNDEVLDLASCFDMCRQHSECRYVSYWMEMKWCRLTEACPGTWKSSKLIGIYERIPEVVIVSDAEVALPGVPAASLQGASTEEELSPGVPATSAVASSEFSLIYGPGSKYCGGTKLYSGNTSGQAECAAKCLTMEGCAFYSFWLGNLQNWCSLSTSCDVLYETAHTEILIYQLEKKETQEVVYELFMEDAACNDAKIKAVMTSGVEECADLCLDAPGCNYASIYAGGWCKLTETCDSQGSQDHGDIYYLRPVGGNREHVATADAAMEEPGGGSLAKMQHHGQWCCIVGYLYEDPCSECVPSLTPSVALTGNTTCGASEEACGSCEQGDGSDWLDPIWCDV